MKNIFLTFILSMISIFSHAEKDNVIEISLIQNDFNVWLDNGNSLLPWKKIINKTPEVAVNTDEIKKNFDENEVFFNKKYRNKWVRIKGVVDSVKVENNEIFINLNSQYYTFRAYTEFGEYASELKKNESIDLYCFDTIPKRKFLVPYSASKCIPYGSYILGNNAKEYFNQIQLSKDFNKVELLSSILYEIIPREDLKQYCTSIENNEKCMTLFNNYIEKFSKSCKKDESENCIKYKKFINLDKKS